MTIIVIWQLGSIITDGECVRHLFLTRCLDAAIGTIGKHVYTNGSVGNEVGQVWNPTSGELKLQSVQTCVDGGTLLMGPCGVVGNTAGEWASPSA